MSDTDGKEESWIQKLPKVIFALAALIFIIIIFSNHNQYIKWKKNQAELSGEVQQTSDELARLRDANGSLQDVTKKVETLRRQAAEITAALEKLDEEKIHTEAALSTLRQIREGLNEQIAAGKNKVAKLTKEAEYLKNTNQSLRDDIVNKKKVLESIVFLQRQKSSLEQNIQELKTSSDFAANAVLEQQARLEALDARIKEGQVALQTQREQHMTLSSELSELTEAVEELSSKKEKLAILDDHRKRLEYLEYLQLQKEALEKSINSLLEKGRKLEEEGTRLQQGELEK